MQGMQAVRYGPTGDVGIVGITRGGIRNGKWLIPGATRPHQIELDSGRLGFGPMHLKLDGQPVLAFSKPNRKAPVVASPPGVIDGYQVVIYAESLDNGNSITCDLFLNGQSMLTGRPLAALGDQANVAVASSREGARVGGLVLASNVIWVLPAVATLQSVRLLGDSSAPIPPIAYPLLIGAFFAIAAVAYAILERTRKRTTISPRVATLTAVAVYAVAFLATLAVIAVAASASRG